MVLCLIDTEDTWSTNDGITYLSKYHDPFYNVNIRPVDHPLVMSKLFGSVSEVDSHNKSINYGLALENY